MKITIEINDIGQGRVTVKCNPSVDKMMKMCKDKNPPASIAYAGLALKKFFESIPHKNQAVMPGDSQAFTSGIERQAPQRSKILLPGQDF